MLNNHLTNRSCVAVLAAFLVSSCQVVPTGERQEPTRHVFLSKLEREGRSPVVHLDPFGQPASIMSLAPLANFHRTLSKTKRA